MSSILDLPPEIMDEIISYYGDPGLPRNRDMLCSLRLVHRNFQKSCTRALFSVINLQPSLERSLPQMEALRTLKLNRYIRRLLISSISAVPAAMLKDGGNRVLHGCREQEEWDKGTAIPNPVGPSGDSFNATVGRSLQTFGSALVRFFTGFGQCELQRLTLDVRCRMLQTTSKLDGVTSHPFSHELTNRFLKTFWMAMSFANLFYLDTLKVKTNSWYMENKWKEVCHTGSFRRIKNFDFELSTRDSKLAAVHIDYPILPTKDANEPTPNLARMSLNCHRRPQPALSIWPPVDPTISFKRLELQGFSLEARDIQDALPKLVNLEHLMLCSVLILVNWGNLSRIHASQNFESYRASLPLWGNIFQTAARCPKLIQIDFDELDYNDNHAFVDFPQKKIHSLDVEELDKLYGVVNERRSQQGLKLLNTKHALVEPHTKFFEVITW